MAALIVKTFYQWTKQKKITKLFLDIGGVLLANGWGRESRYNVIPADKRWYRNYKVANTVLTHLNSLKLDIPNHNIKNMEQIMKDNIVQIEG